MSTPQVDVSDEPVSTSLQAVVAFFASELAGIGFPDAKGGTLDAATLSALVEQVHQRAEEVQEAQRTLGEAQLALSRAHDALSHNAERALAYARVFCQHEPERLEQIAAIQRQGLKKRGKKQSATSAVQKTVRKKAKKSPGPSSPHSKEGPPAIVQAA